MNRTNKITAEESARRAEAVRYATATNELEGLKPSATGQAIMARYVAGELTVAEMLAQVKATRPAPV